MTEYDYSPAARDRFMESQSRVGRWVDNSNHHAREFANPFVPSHSDPSEKSDFYASSSLRRSKSTAVRSSATRSHAVPEPRGRDYGYHRSDYRHRQPDFSPDTRSSSNSSATSSSTIHTARPYKSRSHTMHSDHIVHAPLQPVRSRTMPDGYPYESRRLGKGEIVLPPMKTGQPYVIIPPHANAFNVVSPDGSHVVHRVASPSHSYRSSPTKEQPLIKRLFGLGSSSGSTSRSGSNSSRLTGVETGGKPRRSNSRRTSY